MIKQIKLPAWLKRIFYFITLLGPGLITASAGNDAPGIATYSVAGSTYGYSFLWVILVIIVGIVLVQEMAARMGTVTGKGTADLIRERFGVKVTALAMLALLLANLGTTVAEFAGVAAAGELFGISRYLTVPIAGLLFTMLILRGNYKNVEKVLLVLTLSAMSYLITLLIIKPDWAQIAHQAVSPKIPLDANYMILVLAVIGTTITPWGIFYLQASIADKGKPVEEYGETRLDVVVGSIWGNIISAVIIIVTAATLFKAGIVVTAAEEAAQALAPFAGEGSKILFAVGFLGASLLAVSVLPLSTTYAFCEAFGFERGLNHRFGEAPVFYVIFGGMILLGMVFALLPSIPLFDLMILSQTINAVLLPLILVLFLIIANDRNIMGKWVNSSLANILTILLIAVVVLATVAMFVTPLIT
ncbi:MAG: Nramp family divalent metal transporter [Chloroflexi bacterium]|nr:Nramp family divalent metal transporter [Chloroflexota bacterium]